MPTDGGLDEVVDEMNGGKSLYVFMRVTDPNTELPKNVLVNWVCSLSNVWHDHVWKCIECVCVGFRVDPQPTKGWESNCKHNHLYCLSLPQQGEGVPVNRKGACARHTHDVATFFRVSSVTLSVCPQCTLSPCSTGGSCDHQCKVRDGSGRGQCSWQSSQSLGS